ncbi:hypothetical protein H0H92_011144 [Tricholoma furcatifolium]|nr:hypothetical protein H0H92_011144 [Tricholoma furcatifolium]
MVSHGGEAGGWEAQVAREMVRISLEHRRSRSQEFDEVAKSGQARGNRPVGTLSLGSPFLFQDAQALHTSTAKHCSTTQGPYQVFRGNSDRKKMPLAMKDSSRRSSSAAKSKSPDRLRSPLPPSKTNTTAPSTSHLAPPSLSFTAASPVASSVSPILHPPASAFPGSVESTNSALRVPATPPAQRPTSTYSNKGKRKADEAGVEGGNTPPKEAKEPRATFAVGPRPHRASANSNSTQSAAPSSYQRKRVRLSTTQESRPGSSASATDQNSHHNYAATTGSWSSKMSKNSLAPSSQHPRQMSPSYQPPQRASSRRSLSQASIPMSALISPHAPSISHSTTFHMRDPRKPAPIQRTPWSLSLPSGPKEPGEGWRGWTDRGGSPLHAWLFFVGFILFPLWWVASVTRVPETRRLDAGAQEKGVILDDPQVEFGAIFIVICSHKSNSLFLSPDAKSWRLRCRVMAVISFFTYIPFIVCVAIFA